MVDTNLGTLDDTIGTRPALVCVAGGYAKGLGALAELLEIYQVVRPTTCCTGCPVTTSLVAHMRDPDCP